MKPVAVIIRAYGAVEVRAVRFRPGTFSGAGGEHAAASWKNRAYLPSFSPPFPPSFPPFSPLFEGGKFPPFAVLSRAAVPSESGRLAK